MSKKPRVHCPSWGALTVLVATFFGLFLWVHLSGGVNKVAWVYYDFGLSLSGLESGKFWQLISHALLHGNWMHVIANSVMIWIIGGRVLEIIGTRKWLVLALLSTLVGGLFQVATEAMLPSPVDGLPQPLVGASGMAIGCLIMLTTLSPESRFWPVPVLGKNLGLGIMLAELFLWLMQPGLGLPGFELLGQFISNQGGAGLFQMSHACHLGGGLVGWLMARRMLKRPPTLNELQKQRHSNELSANH